MIDDSLLLSESRSSHQAFQILFYVWESMRSRVRKLSIALRHGSNTGTSVPLLVGTRWAFKQRFSNLSNMLRKSDLVKAGESNKTSVASFTQGTSISAYSFLPAPTRQSIFVPHRDQGVDSIRFLPVSPPLPEHAELLAIGPGDTPIQEAGFSSNRDVQLKKELLSGRVLSPTIRSRVCLHALLPLSSSVFALNTTVNADRRVAYKKFHSSSKTLLDVDPRNPTFPEERDNWNPMLPPPHTPLQLQLPTGFLNHENEPRNKSKLSVDEWMKLTFSSAFGSIDELYTRTDRESCNINNDDPDVGCLINVPVETMGHALIDFNVIKAVGMVDKVTRWKLTRNERIKPVLYTLRGMGGGKTRCLEELRRELLRRRGYLCLGITYNRRTSPSSVYDRWGDTVSRDVSYALSTVSRIANVLYAKGSIGTVHELMMAQRHQLDLASLKEPGPDIIQAACKYFIERVAEHRPVDTFVLLIDEAVESETFFALHYKDTTDATSNVRSGILSESAISPGVSSALVISSLALGPLGRTTSKRPIRSLIMPPSLDAVKVVSDWWKISEDEDRKVYEAMLLFATMVNTVPRAVEIAAGTIEEWKQKSSPYLTLVTLPELLVDIEKNVDEIYSGSLDFPEPSIFFAILFHARIYLDDAVAIEIRNSMLTNAISEYDKLGIGDKRSFFPVASLLFLRAAAAKTDSPDVLTVQLADAFLSATDNILLKMKSLGSSSSERRGQEQIEGDNSPKKKRQPKVRAVNSGDVLEAVSMECLRLRWSVLVRFYKKYNAKTEDTPLHLVNPLPPPTLCLLLGIPNPEPIWNMATRALLETKLPLDFIDARTMGAVKQMQSSSRTKSGLGIQSKFADELIGVQVTPSSPLVFLLSAAGDSWDLGIKVLVPVSKGGELEPLYILIDAKSKKEEYRRIGTSVITNKNKNKNKNETKGTSSDGPAGSVASVRSLPGDGKQYEFMSKVMKERDLRFLYVYMETGKEKKAFAIDDAYVMGSEDMERLMGPMWDLYTTVRRLIGDITRENDKK